MAKKKKRKKEQTIQRNKKAYWDNLPENQQIVLCFAIILILILGYFFPIVFEGKEPPASDTLAWKGNAQSILEAKKKYNYIPLWANNVFAGTPAHLISLQAPFEQPARYFLTGVSKIINWRPVYYFVGAIGMVLLMKFLGCSTVVSMLTSLAFIWWPHLIGLLQVGHNTKVRTMMLMPFILLSFLRLIKKPDLLNAALFTIIFSLGIQARHYQIMFYTSLMLAFFGVAYIIKLLRQREWRSIGVRLVLLTLSLAFALGISAFPVLPVQEYSKYSIRGGTGEQGSKGLTFDYATNWSLHPGEMLSLVIPRFYGGNSTERYEGNHVPQLKGKTIPGYWGHMPFTSSTNYIGVITVFLAAIALGFLWRDRSVAILSVLIIFSLLIAFGRHFPLLFNLFFDYVPFFNKFRVPSMILVLVHFSSAILAGLGVELLFKRSKENISKENLIRGILIIFGLFLFVGLVPFLFKSTFGFARPEEITRYQPEILSLLKEARFGLMKGDIIRMLILVSIGFAILLAYLKDWLSRFIFVVGILALLLVDLFGIDKRYMKTLVKKENLEQYFAETPIDKYLIKDSSLFRIFPLGELYADSRWSYYHQSIGGYHAAKLRIIQDINEFCLYKGSASAFQNDSKVPINWNVVNMLNVKYVLAKGTLDHPKLSQVLFDNRSNIFVYENHSYLPRDYCVGEYEVVTDKKNRFIRLNDSQFNPAETVILEKTLNAKIEHPTNWSTKITRYEPNYIDVTVETDKQTLLVLSEVYYPAGWKAFVDDTETEILKTNHILRSIVVPKGKHNIEFRFEPKTYYASLWIMGISIAIVYLVLGLELFRHFHRQKLKWIKIRTILSCT